MAVSTACRTYSPIRINHVKARAARAARIDLRQVRDNGCADPTPILLTCGCLGLRPGWRLQAYVRFGGMGADSRVMALDPGSSADADGRRFRFSSIHRKGDAPYVAGRFDHAVAVPVDAHKRFMKAVQGNGTPWSYLCASVMVRQLLDFAAWWHDLAEHDWLEHTIVSRRPRRFTQARPERSPAGAVTPMRPKVFADGRSVRVRFFTYRPAVVNPQGLWLHEDHYVRGSYDPDFHRTEIARGSYGDCQY